MRLWSRHLRDLRKTFAAPLSQRFDNTTARVEEWTQSLANIPWWDLASRVVCAQVNANRRDSQWNDRRRPSPEAAALRAVAPLSIRVCPPSSNYSPHHPPPHTVFGCGLGEVEKSSTRAQRYRRVRQGNVIFTRAPRSHYLEPQAGSSRPR